MTSWLDDIKEPSTGDVTIAAAQLGERLAAILQGLKVIDAALVIGKPVFAPRVGGWLDISGVARGVLRGRNATVHLRLFEGPEGQRECLMRFEAPGRLDDVVTGWLSSFATDPWEVLNTVEGVRWCVVSSRDFTGDARGPAIPLPDGWPKDELPLKGLAAGVTCLTDTVEYDGDFVSELETKVGTPAGALQAALATGPAVIRLAPPEPESKPRRDAVHMLRLRPANAGGAVALPGFAAELAGAEVLLPMSLPLDDDGLAGPRVCLPGKLRIGAAQAKPPFEVRAEFDLLSETVTARLIKPPNLRELPGLTEGEFKAAPLAEFDRMLDQAKAEAWIVLNWSSDDPDRETVLAIGGAVGWDEKTPIELVPERLTFAPSLALEVDHPFTPGQRQLSGRMDGSLTLLDNKQEVASLTGSVEIPGWYFTATAKVPKVEKLVGALGLRGIALPEPVREAQATLALSGDVATKSFSAELEFAEGVRWEDGADRRTWALSKLAIGVRYNGETDDGETDAFEFMVSAELDFQDFTFDVSGGYEGGWVLYGGMKEDGTLDVSKAMNGLLQGLSPPADMPTTLVLKDVAFAAELSAGNFSVRGRTAEPWKVVADLEVTIEAMEFARSKEETEVKTTTNFAVRLKLGGVDMLLEASKDAGWLFKGSSRPGQKISIAAFLEALREKLHAPGPLPPALADFAFEAISVSYDTGKSKFEFGCTGHLMIEHKEVKATVTVSYTRGGEFEFTAQVQVGGLDFKGAVLADQAAKTTMIVATFQTGDKHGVSLSRMLSDALQSGSFPDLDVGLKEALFVYRKEDASEGMLFGVKLDLANATIDLGALPVLKALVGSQRVGAENLNLLLATAEFPADGVNAINQNLPKSFTPLPSPKGEGKDAKLGRGAHVTGTLKLGPQAPVPLVLPMGGGAPAPAHAAPVEPKKTAEPEGTKWLAIGKSLGPLHVGRVGLQYVAAEKRLGFLLDSSVDLAGLHVGLTGFALRVPLEADETVTFGLDGLDLAFDGGAVAVAGALLRRRVAGAPDSYDGLALIKAPTFSISALGSFTTVAGSASVFIFGALHGELGGPPAFRLQGLAAGFGYNRRLKLPPIEQVHEFPLVRAAMDASFIQTDQPDKAIGTAMARLAAYVAPSLGDYWLAAGIKFSSFEMVTAITIVSVAFGNDVEIGLLGLARMSLPRGAKGNEIAYAELALRASVRPRDGTVIVEGRLTDASFILSKDCRLTGGFAFCAWFSGQHAGDFVVTLGGYHPEFPRPEHYPIVPRLGVHWAVTPELTIAAELYFALTPSCNMTGGRMAAVYTSRNVRAWFVIHADFLVRWEPLHYEVSAAIRIGLAIDLEVVSLLVDLQVALRMWGPPFAGRLDVDLGVIIVAIEFGGGYREPVKLDAEAFRRAFLPADDAVLAARVDRGLLRREIAGDQRPILVVNAHEMTLSVESVVPLTAFGGAAARTKPSSKARLGVRPMALESLESLMSVTIERTLAPATDKEEMAEPRYEPVELHNLRLEPINTGVPAALWSPAKEDGVLPPAAMEAEGTLPATVGLRIALEPRPAAGSLPWMSVEKLGRLDVELPIPPPVTPPEPCVAAPSTIADTMSPATTSRRDAVLSVLVAQRSPFALEKVDLRGTAGQAKSCFQQDPIVCALGTIDEQAPVA